MIKQVKLTKTNKKLPIYEKEEEILLALKRNQVLVIAGETGSGKTTQLPKFCIKAGPGKKGRIAVTQPRRIAATSTAQRVADEMGCALGSRVGYKIRMYEKLSRQTEIIFMTDGILLNEIQSDRLLKKYQTIMIDEAHERSLNIDFLLGYIKNILPQRPDLKLIISSATIDTSLFSGAFGNAPVIEVSGRLFPVDVWNQPLDENELESGSFTYVDAAVHAVEEIFECEDTGDVLVFMPTERDIHETIDKLEGRSLYNSIILPLFSRLTRTQQNRIFANFSMRKIIVATNIAETSITVPGIKFVVDTGLARINRYAPGLRTNRLPVEPISQASADQRKGRCGRVSDGLCIRLYSEEDYLGREKFTMPEIRRSNLASVILTMSYLRLGNIESFPFVEAPEKRTVKDAFSQLKELGALDKHGNLTDSGKKMARLPIEPHVSRMILQAKRENALREVLIIASGLSIVDPRERPKDKADEADTMHKRFLNPDSDFLTLLSIWDTYQTEWEQLKTQNRMRRFCREHFLSYRRMQEWHDVHRQIFGILKDMQQLRLNPEPASSNSIHRAILAGLISNVANKKEKPGYTATRNREVFIFPGSVLFKTSPPWIMCHEIVETSKVFARTTASVKPEWCEELAPQMCRYTYEEPFFDADSMCVMVRENVTFFGLPIINGRRVAYRRINPDRACEIFIQDALVNFAIEDRFRFLQKNKKTYEDALSIEAKLREKGLVVHEDTIADFYRKRLSRISSVNELIKVIRKRGSDKFLFMKDSDMLAETVPEKVYEFPDKLDIGGKKLALQYAYAPGEEHDGVTVSIPAEECEYFNKETFEWLVPALWKEKIKYLLKTLPKALRKNFVPVPESATLIAEKMEYRPAPFSEALCKTIQSIYDLKIMPSDFNEKEIPLFLQMRFEITGAGEKIIASGRNYTEVTAGLFNKGSGSRKISGLDKAFKKYEKHGLTKWEFGDMPHNVKVAKSDSGFPVYGFPALVPAKNSVTFKLFTTGPEAFEKHPEGVKKLLEIALEKDIAWLDKELKFPNRLKMLSKPFGGEAGIKPKLRRMILSHILTIPIPPPGTSEHFSHLVKASESEIRGSGYKVISILQDIFYQHIENERHIEKHVTAIDSPAFLKLVKELKFENNSFIQRITGSLAHYKEFLQFPRYMKAFLFCIEKAFSDPSAYHSRMEDITFFTCKANVFRKSFQSFAKNRQFLLLDYIMMTEEYKISMFAQQHIKTLYPVSRKRLKNKLEKIEE